MKKTTFLCLFLFLGWQSNAKGFPPMNIFCADDEMTSIELQLFQAYRYANNQSLSDAVQIYFSPNGDNAVLSNDAPKLYNLDETIARVNGNTLLSIENRALPIDGETLPILTDQYQVADYVSNVIVTNMPEGTTAYLVDNYLGTHTELANNQETAIFFEVDMDVPESIALDRFFLSFEINIPADFVYEDGNWSPQDPIGIATADDDVLVANGTTSFSNDLEINDLTVNPEAVLYVKQALLLNGNLINNGTIIFESTESTLGQIGTMTGTVSGTGEVIVERHIHARDDGKGAYRYLASAVNSLGTIHDDWQEGAGSMANPNPGYGMFITGIGGAANGFDTTEANAPSLFTFDNTDQEYVPLANTNLNQLTAGQAYTAYVWGDRSVDISTSNDPTATSTTLRTTGDLYIGDKIISNLSQTAGGFSLIGNPYQAIVNMNDVVSASTNLNTNFYYVWDPNLGTRGAYATVNLATSTSTPSESEANQFLMPGQAVWVLTENAGAASLTFSETAKTVSAVQTDVFRTTNNGTASIELQLFRAERYANGQSLSDALLVNFTENGDNDLLSNDAPKMYNMDETIARVNGGALLSIENRAFPIDGETLPLLTDQYGTTDYVFNAIVANLPSGTTAYLLDNHLGTQTELANNVATPVEFSVDANIPASIATDRFSLVFSKNTMGVDDNLLTDGLSIYPNPVKNGEFFIATSGLSGEKVQVSLYNILGQKVYVSSETVNVESRVNVPATSLEAGVYLVEMKHNGKTFTGKVVIKL